MQMTNQNPKPSPRDQTRIINTKEKRQHNSHRNTSGLEDSKYASEYGTTKRREFYQIGMSRK